MPSERATRVMIVDDEAPQVRALCDTLAEHGYETSGFATPAAALAALQPDSFDLVLADLAMPGMDGITLLKSAFEVDRNLVGIIMTGEGTITTAVEAMKSGALDYILKPFKLSAILPVLARATAMRTLRIENAALHESLRERAAELEAMNKELEAFSYSVSHDLSAPLRAISGFSEILEAEHAKGLDGEGARILGVIRAGAAKMEVLIADLLAFSRLGRKSIAKTPIDMGALVAGVVDQLQRQHSGPWPVVVVDPLPMVDGDVTLLQQVWVNLISNAVKYSVKAETPRVCISARVERADVVFSIQDNGVGFDMKYYDQLFGVFQRLHSDEEFAGTGIGLAIVQRVVVRHGGRVWAEGVPGKGAEFYFSLPTPD